MAATILDKSEFNAKLTEVVETFTSRREVVQELLVDAQAFFYVKNEQDECNFDASRFTDIVNRLHGTGVVATVKLCDYIETIAPVKRAKGKTGVKFVLDKEGRGGYY